MTYDLYRVAQITGGEILAGGVPTRVLYLIQDSRRVIHPESSLFFAIQTAKRDGHDFIADAYKAGVRQFVVSRDISERSVPGAGILKVDNTLKALGTLAAAHRAQFHLPVVGITGSNGKTIVKEWLYQLLHDRYTIVRSPRSYNSQIGVPLSVWQIRPEDTLGIFEAGISLPGEMERLEPIIRPTYGILTNIGAAHDEGFQNREEKLKEKLKLFIHADWLIYNEDDPNIQVDTVTAKKFSWSRKNPKATLHLTNIKAINGKTTIEGIYENQIVTTEIPFTDEASIENAIHCWSLLLLMQVPDRGMARLQPVAMRLELKQAQHQCTLINDSYSADLDSLYIALDFLSQQHQHPRKTVILSDLLETGLPETEVYKKISQAFKNRKVDRFIGIGPRIKNAQRLFDGIKDTHFYNDTEEFLKSAPGFHDETILLKGARAFAFERISRLLELQAHQTVLEIDLDAMARNLQAHRQRLSPQTRIMAMVKAFSYGSGSYEIANLLQFHKVDYLAVAYADEGVHLRDSGITMPIMVMNPETSAYETLVRHHLEPEIFSFSVLKTFRDYLEEEGIQRYPVHIKLDTGMHRLGFMPVEIATLAKTLQTDPAVEVRSVFSHLAASEDPSEDTFTRLQAGRFIEGCAVLRAALPYPFLQHIDNTAGALRHPEFQFDMVRLGIGLYGVDGTGTLPLEEVSTLKTNIAQLHRLEPGETVGYNRRGTIDRPSLIATVRIGYADGYPRRLGNGVGRMLVRGRLAPTIGAIAMDMCMLDVTGIGGVEEGDEVVVFGAGLSVSQVAGWAGTIPYEILTGVSQRVRRIYFEQ
ncbi:MAG TPA: bifunctional UDP-N-acetylmuramoyl-tripeptide:D-alanyl-D-alanine ligase/alanine racemase [Dinghuibacter sp.]|uniref:bifunctional UDP-N-acetylmuramoyl-tripeptide:D-alanyl-D-alanine ligase/alanine racemase n=1 Tax=Dinghuibacter sp. TaxID=2024697 RepID=UPI002BB3A8CD|nr:bifunctional UDP-N-acetylmuramoyl-tripeptide:D-alanyl-D-alanine ligase/alanine racemase [Dinghuibacter sp.]HTJ14400.1 bifunctional UDP-N-acetylmuramoyl-tripeptide:D-alanyl-D-alanine ligase/alanine racemase [Dinghuibacter sp.]